MAELDTLMEPASSEPPAGPDLSYDPERQEIEDAFEIARAADNGEGDPPDWSATIRTIKAQSKRTKDAWLAVYLARAGARAQQLGTVALGCEFLAGMLETWWDEMHPQLEEYGFQGRKGACDSLASFGDFVIPLRRVVVVEHPRLGRYTGEDLVRFADEGDQADGIGMFRAAIADMPSEELEQMLSTVDSIRSAIGRVDAVLVDKGEAGAATNFTNTYEALDTIRSTLARLTGLSSGGGDEAMASDGGEAAGADSGGGGGGGAPRAAAPAVPGRIESRADVARALDSVIEYYQRVEPASPVPMVLVRAKAWVNMDFMMVLKDIAPDAVRDARRVLTINEDD